MRLTEIQSKIANARHIDFGNVISECIELFKKVWVQGLLTILIIAILTVPMALLSSFILEMFGVITPTIIRLEDFNFENLTELYGFNSLYNFPFAIISASIQIGVLGGFYRMVKLANVHKVKSEDYFFFFNKEHLGKIVLLAVLYSGVSLIAQMLCFIPMIYAFVPLMYVSVVFAYNSEKTVEEIFKLSFSLGNKKWLLTFGSLITCFLLGLVGIIACFIGILFTISIVYLPCYIIYRDVVGFEDESELNQIGKI